MNKLLLALIVIALVAGASWTVYLRQQDRVTEGNKQEPTPASREVPAGSNPISRAIGPNDAPASPTLVNSGSEPVRPTEAERMRTVGKQPYHTGIRDDQRVRPAAARGKRVLTEGSEIAEQLHSTDGSPEEDLQIIDEILALYRSSFRENPLAGDNQMVMEALLGENQGNLVVFPRTHPALDEEGQLLDRWGTPYFFHALSGQEMEIFSAGPDGEFNTTDDVHFSNRDGQPLTGADAPPIE